MLRVVFSEHNLFGVVFPKPVFAIDAIPNTDIIRQYAVRCVSKHSQPNDANIEFSRCCVSKTLKSDIRRFS